MEKRSKHLMFLVLYIAAMTVSLSQQKIPPIMDIVANSLNITIAQASWLMSAFTLAGIVLAIPGAAIMNKIGPKNLLLTLMASLFIGNILGAFANTFVLMLISRVIEGIAFAMIIMVGLVMVNTWYSGSIAGTMVGVFNTFGAVGPFIAMNIAIPLVGKFGLKSLWLLIAGLSALSFILVLMIIDLPNSQSENEKESQETASVAEAIKNGKMWILALMQGCVTFVLFTYITSYPRIFVDFYKLEPVKANFYASLNGLFGIPFCIIGGAIVDKTGKPAALSLISFLVLSIVGYTTTLLGPTTFIFHILASAIFPGFIMTAVFTMAPSIAKSPAYIGYTIAFVNLVYYIASFICTPVVLSTATSLGWPVAKNIVALVAIVGAILTVIFMRIAPGQQKSEH
ncbi:MFS transporter [Tepidanaerobacter syntrophicus]|uniref:MFS transporter n=1 Tax=Tepidanaerobacter syntrophicus TaxID=224999 RepID=UPI001BD41D0A|nr:MFS transporter [Tepidanaerobacter syntrophicus]